MRQNLTDLSVQRLKPAGRQYVAWDSNLPAFGCKVGTRTKSFVVKVGNKLSTLGRYPDMALKEARSLAKAAQVAKSTERAPKTPRTYPEAVLTFLEDKKGRLTRHSYKAYTRYLKCFTFTGKVHDITKADIREELKRMDGKAHAQNMAFIAMRTFLNWCVKEDIIQKSPLFRSELPNKTTYRKRVLTDAELVSIWNACEDDTYGRIVRILMLNAARREEVSRAVELDARLVFPETKNGTHHSLPITPLVRKHLKLPFVFKRWSAYKRELDKRSGVKGWRLHDLRRTAASNMAKLKVSPHIIEKVLNHKTGVIKGISLIYNQYEYDEEVKEALLTLEAHMLKILSAHGNQAASRRDDPNREFGDRRDGRETGASQRGDEDGGVLEAAHRQA